VGDAAEDYTERILLKENGLGYSESPLEEGRGGREL